MSAHVSNSIPVSESNVELLSMETKPAQPATTTQLAVPGTQKPGLTIPPSPTLKKSGTFNTRSISDALASEAELREMKQREKIKKLFGLSVVVILILVVWALMFLPTVFFHVGQDDGSAVRFADKNISATECTSAVTYSPPDNVRECSSLLQQQQSCLGLAGGEITIPPGSNVEEAHTRANLFLSSLPILMPSVECQAVVEQFICYFIFGLCDGEEFYQPSSTYCTTVTDDICRQEFLTALSLTASAPQLMALIPQCDTLPDTMRGDCTGTGNTTGIDSNDTGVMTVISNCSEGFYLDGMCRPECGVWQQYPDAAITGVDAVFIFSIVVYLTSAAVVIVLSLIRYKRMFKFPSVFVVYGTLTGGVYMCFILFGYFNRDSLFCSSRDLQESVEEPTAFCTVQGIFLFYCPLMQTSFWFCHVVAVFWTIQFPITARRFENKGYFKFVHLGMVAAVLVLPWITLGIILGTQGYVISRFPTILCFPRNVNVTFYAFILPLSIILATGMSLIVIIFWVLIGLVQIHNESKKTRSLSAMLQAHLHINPAELKILLVFVYSIVFAVIGLITFTVSARDASSLEEQLTDYFVCEARGAGGDCPQDFTSTLVRVDVLLAVSVVLLAIYPIVNLVYVVNIQDLKKFFVRQCGRMRGETATTMSSV